MNIFAVMISCHARERLRNETLANLASTDWPSNRMPFVRIDDSCAERPQQRQEENSRAALQLGVDSKADWILFLEDDLAFNIHLWHNLSHWSPLVESRMEFASLYNPTIAELRRDDSRNYFIADPHAVYGSQAFLISRACTDFILEHWEIIPGMQDIKCSRLAAQFGTEIYYHSPSLVQHTGQQSAWGGNYHWTRDFSVDFKARVVP
jgi:hypothetical protein